MDSVAKNKKISIFGSTGSIGKSTVDILIKSKNFDVISISGGQNIKVLANQARLLNADLVVTAYDHLYDELKALMADTNIRVAAGHKALVEAAEIYADIFVSSIIGFSGLNPTVRCLKHGSTLALANKESLVVAGQLLQNESKRYGAQIIPIDSEHSGLFQLLNGNKLQEVEKMIITASGGEFRNWPAENFSKITVKQASSHPTWKMGFRITIDSNSMFNKAMELIETKELFGINHEKIDVLVHPESIIHALIGFKDGGMMAHLSKNDMKHAISYALNFPERIPSGVTLLDFNTISTINFEMVSEIKFPALRIARQVLEAGGLSGVVFNASKEVALDRFISTSITFDQMSIIVQKTLNWMEKTERVSGLVCNLENIFQIDSKTRKFACKLILD